MKTYIGSPAAARNYVEADRSRADDYYLTEGVGVAERFSVDADGHVVRLDPLAGDGYEAWVAGLDPDTGEPRGRLRTDARGVRFVEVTVNGPKSWSLAAELHPDIAAAYDAAQEAAAAQVIGWLGQHATTRVGPRGGQVQVPVERLEAVTVRHYTSRAGDPHRHLHLQVNARVFAAGGWRGLHTVGVRDSLNAVNGIGTAAMTTDPQFRAALARHGFTLDSTSGEIRELAPFVGAFSKRAAQITRHLDRYEAEWRAVNPGREPGPKLRQAWDRRAWAEQRPDKVTPTSGAELHDRWLAELAELGYRPYDQAVTLTSTAVGRLNRDAIAEQVLRVVATSRSGWNAADLRGQVEQQLVALGMVVDPAVRLEVAEDITARALTLCMPLLDRTGVPEHIRALTSRHVLQVEGDLITRLADRSVQAAGERELASPAGSDRPLDPAQQRVVAALAGDQRLVVIEGAAGAGKTTVLAATRDQITAQDRRLVVVTPTLKAAQVAEAELGSAGSSVATSVAWLMHQHGWRWTSDGHWARLQVGDTDPTTGSLYHGPSPRAVLTHDDLVLVDEAGMLDQDTARALLTLADEHRVRLAFVGDRHQLAAVGRGGVLDLAARWVDPAAHLSLYEVHRFTRAHTDANGATVTVADTEYAQLSLSMRTGDDPDAVFNALLERGQVQVHPSDADRFAALADAYVDAVADQGAPPAVVVDTREQVAELNAVIRERLVATGRVDDRRVMTTAAGERIGVDDVVVTRRNDTGLDIANRDTWTVTHLGDGMGDGVRDGVGGAVGEARFLGVTGCHRGERELGASYVARHVELGYATTAHGVQGDTVTHAHLLLGDYTSAASAYVGMTRGRQSNTVHLVAESVEDAREQWATAFSRDRADLGPSHAAYLAALEADRYAHPRPVEQALEDVRAAWSAEADCRDRLAELEPLAERLREIITVRAGGEQTRHRFADALHHARDDHHEAVVRLEASSAAIEHDTSVLRDRLLGEWDAHRDAARAAATVVHAGPGRLGFRLAAVNRAQEHLAAWSMTWQPYLPDMPTHSTTIARYAAQNYQPSIGKHLEAYARTVAEGRHPDHRHLQAAVDRAAAAVTAASRADADAREQRYHRLASISPFALTADPARVEAKLTELDRDIAATRTDLDQRHHTVTRSERDPAIRALPPGRLDTEHAAWAADREQQQRDEQQAQDQVALTRAAHQTASRYAGHRRSAPVHSPEPYTPQPAPSRGIGI
ncbi:MAG TPA: MobF family relaxase [Jatrophihabitans sp.]|jgi:thymidine kinase|uniref:MobF family relaxase n=1 Tax=Jatrophihabitans sp. TaxID=1932789 RepID=UPI002E0855E1|nr:MobF family relaxase [Jatrophihabitans sp.]